MQKETFLVEAHGEYLDVDAVAYLARRNDATLVEVNGADPCGLADFQKAELAVMNADYFFEVQAFSRDGAQSIVQDILYVATYDSRPDYEDQELSDDALSGAWA